MLGPASSPHPCHGRLTHPTPNTITTHKSTSDPNQPFYGGIKIVGASYPVEVPLKLFFDPDDDDEAAAAAAAADATDGDEGKGEGAPAAQASYPRPPLGATTVVAAGWSNTSTHGFLSRACILDPRTNQPRKGVAIKGPPVEVGSHMGEFTSPGTVTVRVQSPEMQEHGREPVAMEFLVYPGTPGVRDAMLGNEQLALLGVEDPMRHRTR